MELRIAFCIYFSKLLANSSEEESISDNASRKLLKTSSKDTWLTIHSEDLSFFRFPHYMQLFALNIRVHPHLILPKK